MKSAYELAMERLNRGDAPAKLTEEQKARIGEIDQKHKATIAGKKLTFQDHIAKAQATGNYSEIANLEKQLAHEIATIEERCEAEKEKVRNAAS